MPCSDQSEPRSLPTGRSQYVVSKAVQVCSPCIPEMLELQSLKGGANSNNSVDLASPTHVVTVHGDFKTTATFEIDKSVRTEQNMTIDGEFNICGSVKVHDGSDISGDAYIGLDRHQIHSVHGDFTVFGRDMR